MESLIDIATPLYASAQGQAHRVGNDIGRSVSGRKARRMAAGMILEPLHMGARSGVSRGGGPSEKL